MSSLYYNGTLQGEIHHVVNPDPYRGIFGSDASSYARDLKDHIDYGTSGKVAGFISETIQVHVNYSLLRCKYIVSYYMIGTLWIPFQNSHFGKL